MTREAFYASLKAGEIAKCYLFEGEEEYTKESALRQLRDMVLQSEFASLNESVLMNPDESELIAHAETLPFLAKKRFVLVKESSWLSAGRSGKGEEQGGRGDSPVDQVVAYMDRLPDSLCLVFFVRGKANGTRKLYKRIQKLGGIVSFDALDQRTMVKWIARELGRYGQQIDRQTAEQLVFAVGKDMHMLSQELHKLAMGAKDSRFVSKEDIDLLSIKTSEYRVFDLSDAVVAGQTSRALVLLEDMLAGGEQRMMLLSLLQRQYRQLLFAKILGRERQSPDAMAKLLGLPAFVARRLSDTARAYDFQQLEEACQLLVDTEYMVKSGQMAEEGSLEQAVLRLLAARQQEASGA